MSCGVLQVEFEYSSVGANRVLNMNSLNAITDAGDDLSEIDVANVHEILTWDRLGYVSRRSETQSGLPYYWADGQPVAVNNDRSRQIQLWIKRGFDVVVAALALIALMPLFILVAIAIKMTSAGPVLFAQAREGLHGRNFNAFKFRSMRTEFCDVSGVAQTVKNDPRVTAIGRFLRRTSIDELPQLLNVLRGEMSLVGPRPHVSGMRAGGTSYRSLIRYYDRRLDMLPGITGWAQANSLRGPTDDAASARARVDHDIAYIQNFSLLLDLKIILLTVQREFLGGSGH